MGKNGLLRTFMTCCLLGLSVMASWAYTERNVSSPPTSQPLIPRKRL